MPEPRLIRSGGAATPANIAGVTSSGQPKYWARPEDGQWKPAGPQAAATRADQFAAFETYQRRPDIESRGSILAREHAYPAAFMNDLHVGADGQHNDLVLGAVVHGPLSPADVATLDASDYTYTGYLGYPRRPGTATDPDGDGVAGGTNFQVSLNEPVSGSEQALTPAEGDESEDAPLVANPDGVVPGDPREERDFGRADEETVARENGVRLETVAPEENEER